MTASGSRPQQGAEEIVGDIESGAATAEETPDNGAKQ